MVRVPGVWLRKPLSDRLGSRRLIPNREADDAGRRRGIDLTGRFKTLRKEFLRRTTHEY